jgi:hypothetical protein
MAVLSLKLHLLLTPDRKIWAEELAISTINALQSVLHHWIVVTMLVEI